MTPEQSRWQRIQILCEAIETLAPSDQPSQLALLEPDPAIRLEALALARALRNEAHEQRVHAVAPPSLHEVLPEALGDVRILALIGSGGSGDVFRGVRTINGVDHVLAVKRYHLHRSRADDLERVAREHRLLATLTHPGIVRVYDAGTTASGRPYLVMELAEGTPITTYADDQRLPIASRLRLLINACSAVQSAHALHILHLDLKPSNIVVTPGGHVKLLDFGTAKLADPAMAPTATEPLTLQYASPERLRGEPVSPACDVYSLGLVLAELCTGQWPFKHRTSLVAIAERAAGTSTVLPLASLVTDAAADHRATTRERLVRTLRGDLDAVVHRALAYDPAQRYSSVESFADDLKRVLDNHPVAAPPPRNRRPLSAMLRRHAWTIAGAVVAGLAFGAAALYATRPAAPAPPPALTHAAQTSMVDTAGVGVTVFAGVRRETPTIVRGVRWRGLYCAVINGGEPPAPTATTFVVAVHPDDGARPVLDAPIFRGSYPASRVSRDAGRTFTGHCGAAQTGVRSVHYEVMFGQDVALDAGVPYWLGIQAVVERLDSERAGFVFWGWDGDLAGRGFSLQHQEGGYYRRFEQRRIFELIE